MFDFFCVIVGVSVSNYLVIAVWKAKTWLITVFIVGKQYLPFQGSGIIIP